MINQLDKDTIYTFTPFLKLGLRYTWFSYGLDLMYAFIFMSSSSSLVQINLAMPFSAMHEAAISGMIT